MITIVMLTLVSCGSGSTTKVTNDSTHTTKDTTTIVDTVK